MASSGLEMMKSSWRTALSDPAYAKRGLLASIRMNARRLREDSGVADMTSSVREIRPMDDPPASRRLVF
jgi:hypothetical protein